MPTNNFYEWGISIERITCFEELIAQEEAKAICQDEKSIERITALQFAIEQEKQSLLLKANEYLFNIIFLNKMGRDAMGRDHIVDRITILSSNLMCNHVLIPAMQNVIQSSEERYTFEIKEAFIDSNISSDFDLSILPFKIASDNYIVTELCNTELNLYASPKYLEFYGEPKVLDDMHKHVSIVTTKGDILRHFANIKYKPIFHNPAHIATDTLNAAIQFGQQGVGIICIPDMVANANKYNLEKIRKLENTYSFSYFYHVHKRCKDLPIIQNTLFNSIKNFIQAV